MREVAIHYPERGKMQFVEIGSPPEPKESEILLRTRYSGITNGTERHALMAEHLWGQFPSRHGYQQVCTVEKVGSDVDGFAPGNWVFYGHYVGHAAWNLVDVSYSREHGVGHHLCVHLPESLDRKDCALMGVAGVSLRGMRRFGVKPADNVWVLGVGPIGQFAAQSARALGARVTVTDVNDKRLEIAKELGAHRVLNAKDGATNAAIDDWAPYDFIVDCSGYPPLLMELFDHPARLAVGGTVGLLAVRTETTFHWSLLHMRQASIEVSCHFELDDLRVLLHFMEDETIRMKPMISHCVSIEEAPRIYETMRDSPADLCGVVFDWTE